MDKQEITDKIIEVARMMARTRDTEYMQRLGGRLEVLFEQLDALNQEVKR